MSKYIVTLMVLGMLIGSGVVHAQTTDLPAPGVLPTSPFYFVKGFFEGVGTFFTFGASAKAERYLALAERRLAEAEALAAQGDVRAEAAVARYEAQYAEARERAAQVANIDLEARVADATTKHLAVLDDVISRVPEEAKEAVRSAKEQSIAGQLEALRGIAARDPERAVDIFARAAEQRLLVAQARAGRGGDGEDESENVGDALEDYEKYAQFGQEISTLAQGIRTGETTVEDLVRRATSRHLQVLESVRTTLPPQAQQEFQRAMDSARQVQQLRPSITAPRQPVMPPGGDDEEEETETEVESGSGGAPAGTPIPAVPGGRP